MDLRRSQIVGEEYRYNHDKCGDTRERLYVKKTSEGYVYHCFNCGWSGFKKDKQVTSLSNTKEYLNARQNNGNSDDTRRANLYLPTDCTNLLPDMAWNWLGRYGITTDEARKYHFQYSPKLRRLILPLYNPQGELIYWQGRTLTKPTKENPKYLNVSVSKRSYAVFNPTKSTSVCLVEDILSAIKVSRQVAAIPILGSYINGTLLTYLKDFDIIYCWLDLDKRWDSLKYSQRIRLLTGKPCSSIITDLDPKEYNDEQIFRNLNNVHTKI